jgi:hypothetical protein
MNEAKSNETRKFQAFGPWATALDTGPGAALSTFWRRRMAMLSTLNRDGGQASWRLRVLLVVGGLAVLALPGLYLSRVEVAQAEPAGAAEPPEAGESAGAAEPPEAAEPEQVAEPTAIAEPVEAAAPAAAPDPTPKAESPTRILLPPANSTQQFNPTPAPATYVPKLDVIPEPSVEYFPEPTEVEKRINEALDKRATFDFVDMPLQTVVDFLMDTLDGEIEILLDNRALEDAGADARPVNLRAKNVPIRTALRLLLGQKDLTYLIQDEVLLITTVDKAETQLVTRTYPIGDLLADVPVMSRKGGLGGKPDGKAPTEPEQPVRFVKDYDSFIECITTTVVPQSWDEVGGPGSITEMPVSSSVVISQTPVVHDEVLQLIRALRAAKRASGVRSSN